MTKRKQKRLPHQQAAEHAPSARLPLKIVVPILAAAIIAAVVLLPKESPEVESPASANAVPAFEPDELWMQRAYAIDKLFQGVYTPGWEGAYGAIGNAYMFAATNDSTLLRFHIRRHNLTALYNGYWVDDRAWACIAEMKWWEVTGSQNAVLVNDAKQRYVQARDEGRLSNHEGYWTWYNWPQNANVNEPIFTNSNMNQMAAVACLLYEATKEQRFLDDALLVWNGDTRFPGIEKTLYKGNGKWEGKQGRAAFGKELPWGGTGYCAIGAALFRATGDPKYKNIVVATAKRILDPATGWVDPVDYFQIHMDGNGAFVNFLLDAYMIAPEELAEVPAKIEKMLEHVWSNHRGKAAVLLHRVNDHGIRNGWNPNGGEDGYGVNEVGTVHAQGEAVRAFGVFAYVVHNRNR